MEAFRLHPLTPFQLRPNFYTKSKISWRCTIVVSFVFIAFLVVKLKNLKCFRGDGASMKWPIFERFRALSSPNVVWFCWNLHQLLLKKSKTLLLEFFWNSIFYRKRTFPKFALFFSFCPILRPFLSVKEAEIQKTKYLYWQNYAIGLSKNCKTKALSCANFWGKIGLLFVLFWRDFGEKRGVVTL